jgi:hypothetical protein
MSKHTNYQPGRKGLTDAKIAAEKRQAVSATMLNKDSKAVVMKALYGATQGACAVIQNRLDLYTHVADWQHSKLRYSDQGDFTNAYRGGFY